MSPLPRLLYERALPLPLETGRGQGVDPQSDLIYD